MNALAAEKLPESLARETLGLGDRVRVLSGPFADLVGELTRIDGAGRVTVLLQLLGGEVPVSIARAALLPARVA